MNKLRIIATVVALAWLLGLAAMVLGVASEAQLTTKIVTTVTLLAYIVYAVRGPVRATAFAAKIVIAAGFISLLSQLLASDDALLSADTAIRSLVLVSGLVLERISPHQQLHSWMFLMIATKIELVLIGTLLSTVSVSGLVPLMYWWSLVAMMLLGVPLLAKGLKIPYRIATVALSIVALVLAADLILAQESAGLVSVLAIITFVWPLVVERLLGYQVFIKNTKTA